MYRLLAIGVFWVALHAPALGQNSEADLHQACMGADRNPNACHTVGEMYEDGNGISQDYGRAIHYYTLACGAGIPPPASISAECTKMAVAAGKTIQKL